MAVLCTIGYERSRSDLVVSELKRAQIDILVDVRAVAASRKPGFSRRQLAAALDLAGISYLHLQKLGTPAAGRQAARAGRMHRFWDIYNAHLANPDAIEALNEIAALLRSGRRVCLLCFERDVNCCHRKSIAENLTGFIPASVRHLTPPAA